MFGDNRDILAKLDTLLAALGASGTVDTDLDTLHADLQSVDGHVDGVETLLQARVWFTVVHNAEVVATVDANGNPLTIQAKTGGTGGVVVQTMTFTYDASGNEASRVLS